MVSLFFGILGLLLGILALFLALPLRVELKADRDEALSVSAVLQPFGRAGPRIPLGRGRKKAPKKSSKRRRGRTAKTGRRSQDPVRLMRAAQHALADILRAIRLDAADLDLRVGLGDPAETGRLYGQMTPLIYGVGGCPQCRVRVEPVFDQAVLAGHAELDLSCIPARILWPLVRFGWAAFGPVR